MCSEAYLVKREAQRETRKKSFSLRDTLHEIRDTLFHASRTTRYVIFLVAWLMSQTAVADFGTSPLKQGWHWYLQEQTEVVVDETVDLAEFTLDPIRRISEIQQELERLKAKAVLDPTEPNILAYVTYQREQLNRASTFSDQFRRVLWTHPELDYTLERPTSSLAKKVWLEKRGSDQIESVKSLAKQYGLFFFFRSDCPYCHRFAPILKVFSMQYGLQVIPVSLDGGGLPEYPNPQLNQGQFERLMGRRAVVPAVLAVNPTTQQVVPVSYGLVTQEELLKRIYVLTQLEVGHDY